MHMLCDKLCDKCPEYNLQIMYWLQSEKPPAKDESETYKQIQMHLCTYISSLSKLMQLGWQWPTQYKSHRLSNRNPVPVWETYVPVDGQVSSTDSHNNTGYFYCLGWPPEPECNTLLLNVLQIENLEESASTDLEIPSLQTGSHIM